MKKGVKKCLLITVCILNFQMCMFSYATARESTPNIKVNRSKSRNVYMKIISATPKTIKIKIFNKSENIARYSESFTLYKYKDGKYKKIKKKTGGKIFPPVKSSGHISYINMIFIFLNYSIDFNWIRTDL